MNTKPSRMYLFMAGIVSLFIYSWAMENLIEVPFLGFFLAWVGWLVPVTFFYGAFTGE